MPARLSIVRILAGVLLVCLGSAVVVQAGTLGFPAARLEPFQFRLELVGESFKEEIKGDLEGEANSGRGLLTLALGLTRWSEIYARVGAAEFNIDEALFNGEFGIAYGGGIRLRLFRLSWGDVGVTGQYLRFTSDDDDSVGLAIQGEWEEFDAALGIGSRRFGIFQFYAGGAYHRTDITLTSENGTGQRILSFEPDIPFRGFVGVHIYPFTDFPRGKFLVNLEARFIGEIPQFTFGVQYAF